MSWWRTESHLCFCHDLPLKGGTDGHAFVGSFRRRSILRRLTHHHVRYFRKNLQPNSQKSINPFQIITNLDHEISDNSMEHGPLVVQNFVGCFSDASVAGTQSSEILRCFRNNVIVHFKDYSTSIHFVYRDVKETSGSDMSPLKKILMSNDRDCLTFPMIRMK